MRSLPLLPCASELTCLRSFADVHYYFSSPTSKPQHHRLSRASYLYLFYNAAEARGKIELANHAGTPDQDAFSGYLDQLSRLTYSHKQPTLFTFTVDGASLQAHDQWHLPSYDERNEKKYLYKIHTLDVYLWTEQDAAIFLAHLKGLLPADKLDIKDAPAKLQTPPAEHRDSMSPVVQQLEKTAIGSQFQPRAGSTTSAQSLPGPPTPAASVGATTSPPPAGQAAPMAYNPAAPAAPEPIAYREKTPPPPDDGSGIGLTNAAKYDSLPQTQYANVPNTFQSSGQPTPQQAYFSGPPGQPQQQMRHTSVTGFPGPPQGTPPQRTVSGSLPPPPPPPQGGPSPHQYVPSFAPPPGSGQPQPSSPPPNQATFNRQSMYGGQPGQTQYASYPQRNASFGPTALASPGMPSTPGYNPAQQQQQQQQQPPTPSAPPAYSADQTFSYSNYSYAASQNPTGYNPANPNAGYAGDVHAQVYRPTEGEAGSHSRPQQPQRENSSQTRQKLEGRVSQVESGVGRFMKRLDKLI